MACPVVPPNLLQLYFSHDVWHSHRLARSGHMVIASPGTVFLSFRALIPVCDCVLYEVLMNAYLPLYTVSSRKLTHL